MPADASRNPFPGLRPFEPEEDHLFFGREKESDELLRRLRTNRFLSVVGTSGSGKSSLVRCGLIPALHSGLSADSGSNWRVAVFRPGEDPLGHLADALDLPDVIGTFDQELTATSRILLEATLRRSTLGLVEAVRQARLPAHENLLVIVDQFEELFRFRSSRQVNEFRDEAVAFVKLLLEAVSQDGAPIYVVLTMRSDFIGDCMEYPGLPEAINAGQYLVPRMTRDELRSAIAGPVAVVGAAIAPRLVLRLLNDLGNDPDQLPVLQHALMRTWDHWKARAEPDSPLDIADYEAVGTLEHALSRHAEEAYAETGSEERQRATERMFKALTDTFTDPRGVRRPCSIAELAAIAEVPEAEVIHIVEIFRRPGRSFLMPPATVPLGPQVIVDLSHESLMREWNRLIGWADDERDSATIYVRLAREASWFEEGKAGLWGTPELDLGLQWRKDNQPTAAWARRYDPAFERAMEFLDRSEKERDRQTAERAAARRRALRQAQLTAVVLSVLLVLAIWSGMAARRAKALAELNFRYARMAVDESLTLVDRDPARLGIDHPGIIEFQRQLARKAKAFYDEFITQKPSSEELQEGIASAHFRLGQINRMLEAPDDAVREYNAAIDQFDALVRDHPDTPEYRQALAGAYNWLGETLRSFQDKQTEAMRAYVMALGLQQELHKARPENAAYQKELARTHNNRGILYHDMEGDPAAFKLAEADFREAIRLLQPLDERKADPLSSQELARVYNNLAGHIKDDDTRGAEARDLYERAVRIQETLTKDQPGDREFSLELATSYDNLADLLRGQRQFGPAAQRNEQATILIEDLARPPPSLDLDLADAHTVRGHILQDSGSPEAIREYEQAFVGFRHLMHDERTLRLAKFHFRFAELVDRIAELRSKQTSSAEAARLLSDAVQFYLGLVRRTVDVGTPAEARTVLDNIMQFTAVLPVRDQRQLPSDYQDLLQKLREKAGRH